MTPSVSVWLSNAAINLASLDDPEMLRELSIERRASTPRAGYFVGTAPAMENLAASFESQAAGGWDFDNPGAAKRAVQTAARLIRAAIAKATQ